MEKLLSKAENFKCTPINAEGYSFNRRSCWQLQLTQHCVNV